VVKPRKMRCTGHGEGFGGKARRKKIATKTKTWKNIKPGLREIERGHV
jgi:hypothetical protein